MEMAHQLIGITMPEPGVSRVVAVDIAEAVELAGSQAQAKAKRRRVSGHARRGVARYRTVRGYNPPDDAYTKLHVFGSCAVCGYTNVIPQ